jgi:hypothetical protein
VRIEGRRNRGREEKLLTQTRSQDDGSNPPPGTGGGLAPGAPARWAGSREAKVPGAREGVKKTGASDPVFSPTEGQIFSKNLRLEKPNGQLVFPPAILAQGA